MDAVPLPPVAQGFAWAGAAAVLAWAARRLPWHKVRNDAEAVRVLAIATLLLAGMRWFNADALQGVKLHFLGATAATLMFGPRFALWSLAMVSAAATAMGSDWQASSNRGCRRTRWCMCGSAASSAARWRSPPRTC
jgi:uncharacterized membrane protein